MSVGKPLSALLALALAACSTTPVAPPEASPTNPGAAIAQLKRGAAVVVSSRSQDIPVTRGNGIEIKDADGVETRFSSAAPITTDGYVLTVDHAIIPDPTASTWIVPYGNGRVRNPSPARVVWKSKSSDLALLKTDLTFRSPFTFSTIRQPVVTGTPVVHGGFVSGPSQIIGRIDKSFTPDGTGNRVTRFRHTVPATHGDSGGPVTDFSGKLLGVNSMVKQIAPLKTRFFVETLAVRPNVRALNKIIDADRRRNPR